MCRLSLIATAHAKQVQIWTSPSNYAGYSRSRYSPPSQPRKLNTQRCIYTNSYCAHVIYIRLFLYSWQPTLWTALFWKFRKMCTSCCKKNQQTWQQMIQREACKKNVIKKKKYRPKFRAWITKTNKYVTNAYINFNELCKLEAHRYASFVKSFCYALLNPTFETMWRGPC